MPNTMESAPLPSVYQLRVVLRGVSPLIWRRLLIPADMTVAGLHAVLQIAFGWGGEHLHRFLIHGVEYGISYPGGVGIRDDPHRLHVAELGCELPNSLSSSDHAIWHCRRAHRARCAVQSAK